MISESIAILAVLILIVLISLKAKYRRMLPLVLPFFAVPLSYLLSTGISAFTVVNNTAANFWSLVIIAVGGVLGSLLVLIVSFGLPTKAIKIGYIVFGVLFSMAFTVAYLINLI